MDKYKKMDFLVPSNDSLSDLKRVVKQRQGTIFPIDRYENGTTKVRGVLKPYNEAIEQIKAFCKKEDIYVDEATKTLNDYFDHNMVD